MLEGGLWRFPFRAFCSRYVFPKAIQPCWITLVTRFLIHERKEWIYDDVEFES